MTRWYLDTSAAIKLLVDERESEALAVAIDSAEPDLVACLLLETELRRVVHRLPALTQQAVSEFLLGVGLYEVSPSLFVEAGLLPGQARPGLALAGRAAPSRLSVLGWSAYSRTTLAWPKRRSISV